jgi:two-component system sensor histidine kinase BaeS
MEGGDRTVRVPVEGADEVTRLAGAFNAMAASIERGDRQREAMVGDVAHELRSPLANVRAQLEAAEDGVLPLDGDLVRSLQEECGLLARLVADLQELAMAESGTLRVHPEERDAADLAAQAVTAHRARAEAAGVAIRLHTAEPVPVLADPARLRQALGNLVGNAVTHAGGAVEVAVRACGGSVLLTVADDGPGIAAEHLPHVFDRFYRVDPSRTRGTGGSGLGLAISRHLVEAHGGVIEVASTPGAGSVFTIRLPNPVAPPGTAG